MLRDSYGRTIRDLRVSITDRCDFRCLYCLPESEAVDFFSSGSAGFQPAVSRVSKPADALTAQVAPTVSRLYRRLLTGEPSQSSPGHPPMEMGTRSETPIPQHSLPHLHPWLSKEEILTFEEIERIVRVAVDLGVEKVRLTGGEPLLRREVETLVRRLAGISGLRELVMTTNGLSFRQKGKALREAGLGRVSFSLDSLEPENFRKITGRDGLQEVLAAIGYASELGFQPVKVNVVIIRGLNDRELEPLAEFARRENLVIRFIEFMPLDAAQFWRKELVVTAQEILARLKPRYSLQPVPPEHPSQTAQRWRFTDTGGEIGIISSVSQPFCGHCSRLRLTADGKLRTCLFSKGEHDIRRLLRQGASDQQLSAFLQDVTSQKEQAHHIGHPGFEPPDRTMSRIGG